VHKPIRRNRHQAVARADYQHDRQMQRDLARAQPWMEARARLPHLFR
jgi:hypothetical protein